MCLDAMIKVAYVSLIVIMARDDNDDVCDHGMSINTDSFVSLGLFSSPLLSYSVFVKCPDSDLGQLK